MRKYTLFTLAILFTSFSAIAKDYNLMKSTVEYIVVHSFKTVKGSISTTKGKAVCSKKNCEILAALKVKEFKSGNSNRDVHVWQIMKAEKFPLVMMSFNGDLNAPEIEVELELVGIKKKIKLDNKEVKITDSKISLRFDFSFSLEDFELERPSLLGIKVENIVKMHIESQWISVK